MLPELLVLLRFATSKLKSHLTGALLNGFSCDWPAASATDCGVLPNLNLTRAERMHHYVLRIWSEGITFGQLALRKRTDRWCHHISNLTAAEHSLTPKTLNLRAANHN